MVVLNLIAALMLALAPALEPCRLHAALNHSHESIDLDHIHADHTHPENADHESNHCPEQPRHCSHLIEAPGLLGLVSITTAVVWPPTFQTEVFCPLAPRPWVQRLQWRHPPPAGVLLVGTSNLRI
ncbi:MAG: hypothetical protein HUU03_12355 [Planctomycetaceae bacterium]|nr:hypothetical protein [Planctomycetota bacterium]MCQ3951360.1 hypothetical protein [Planctomycetota bacterium]NUO17222.1 hypothetical protein [Planctomycetaceae bacterium]RIK60760.1 MAG: hypothetical protein DCC64_14210 [Planctomycetota bacterium]GIK52531.1 MAG: hypothetical protein BroJett014_15040 [Planctomycetota bacterium]